MAGSQSVQMGLMTAVTAVVAIGVIGHVQSVVRAVTEPATDQGAQVAVDIENGTSDPVVAAVAAIQRATAALAHATDNLP